MYKVFFLLCIYIYIYIYMYIYIYIIYVYKFITVKKLVNYYFEFG